jgi:hypothetical protein
VAATEVAKGIDQKILGRTKSKKMIKCVVQSWLRETEEGKMMALACCRR